MSLLLILYIHIKFDFRKKGPSKIAFLEFEQTRIFKKSFVKSHGSVLSDRSVTTQNEKLVKVRLHLKSKRGENFIYIRHWFDRMLAQITKAVNTSTCHLC